MEPSKLNSFKFSFPGHIETGNWNLYTQIAQNIPRTYEENFNGRFGIFYWKVPRRFWKYDKCPSRLEYFNGSFLAHIKVQKNSQAMRSRFLWHLRLCSSFW